MSTPSLSDGRAAASGTGPFATITCGVDGTRAAFEAARQAAVLAQGGVRLRYLAVAWETGTLAPRMLTLARHRAEETLERAGALAHDAGVKAQCAIVDGPNASHRLIEAAGDDDLLVVGASGRSHTGGLVLGHAASELLHDARTSVLVTRTAPALEFPSTILVAVDDPDDARTTGEVAGSLARRHGATVTVVAGSHEGHDTRLAAAEAAVAVRAVTGVEPVVVDGEGRFHRAAAQVASELRSSLIVTAGEHAAKLAECARCSVLVLHRRS
jgi:nucleotide-binding universal stress UspA family protein